MFKKILIANRGEIACRIARTCQRLGIAVAGVHSSADRDALHVDLIGESIEIGGAAAAESYLRIDAVIDAARRTGSQAIHPGFGFLAENAAFARAVEAAGLVFIGPTPEVIERLGDKASAKREARAAGVPVLGGSELPSRDAAEVASIVRGLPLPVILKAAAGGGGKGMRVVQQLDGLMEAIESAMREAKSSFGDAALIVEAFVERGRHIEVQIVGDGCGEVIHLFERECTLQRRHQKVIEEAPAVNLAPALRAAMLGDAVRLGQRLRYRGVGTVEFIVQGEQHHFLEVNPRLQVEHPVTEEVTGIDIVEVMLRIAAGEGLPLRQGEVRVQGHAVEARVCAEDAAKNFLPSTGELIAVRFPTSGVRVESGVRAGMAVTPYYDSMLAKLIAHAPTREAALDRLSLALGETQVHGVETNCAFLQRLLALPATRDASFHTRLIDAVLAEGSQGVSSAPLERLAAAAAWWLLDARRSGKQFGAWSALDVTGWQMHAGDDRLTPIPALLLHSGGATHEVRFGAVSPEPEVTVQIGAERVRLALTAMAGGDWRLRMGDRHEVLTIVRSDDTVFVQGGGTAHAIGVTSYLSQAVTGRQASGQLRTPMMGMILKTHVAVGERVRAGDVVATMESMKMELRINADHDGVVRSLSVQAGQMVERGLVVAVIESEDAVE
ncbi:MAG: ATP-grasp domain-containing protein [Burkholderiales bacterium]|nr:ATP-grasp domain-containing protein [Burkholderiales bacterium]